MNDPYLTLFCIKMLFAGWLGAVIVLQAAKIHGQRQARRLRLAKRDATLQGEL